MLKIYTHENPFFVANIKNLLAMEGVPAELRNEFAASGGGDLPHHEVWQELWVEEKYQALAERVIADMRDASLKGDWTCEHCQEVNAGNFEVCWQCQKERPF